MTTGLGSGAYWRTGTILGLPDFARRVLWTMPIYLIVEMGGNQFISSVTISMIPSAPHFSGD